MKKRVYKLLPLALCTFLVFPSAALAKESKDPVMPSQSSHFSHHEQMNAQWSRFEVILTGVNGEGKITINDNNPIFDYTLDRTTDNGNLANGDTVKILVTNRGGNLVKTLNYPITGLSGEGTGEEDTDKETVKLKTTTQDLDSTYGAVRFLNFNNLGGGAEVYLTDKQALLGTTTRTAIDFYRGTTTDNENPYGNWEKRNKIRFGYDSDEGIVWVELDAEYNYRAEYPALKNADFNTIQFMLLNQASDSDIRLENLKLNGQKLENTVLVGKSTWPKWNLEGDLQNSHGNSTLEADLVITGDQPSNEINKVEIMFGNR